MILARALRTAWPDVAGAVVASGAAFLLHVALVFWLFRGAPDALARYGLLEQLVLVVCAVGTCGLPFGIVRLYPVSPDARADLLLTAWLSGAAVCAMLVAAIQCVPGVARLVLGDAAAAELVAPYLWKAPAVATIAVAAAALQATHNVRRRAAVEATAGVAAATFGVVGAAVGGLRGLLWGSFGGILLVGAMLRPRAKGGHVRKSSFEELVLVGRAQAARIALDALIPFVVLRTLCVSEGGAEEAGAFVAALGFVTPFVVISEVVARALYPAKIGDGGGAGLERARRSLSLQLGAFWVPALLLTAYAGACLLRGVRHGYADAVTALLALLPGVALHVLVASSGRVVFARRESARAAVASAIALAVAVVSGSWLVRVAGAEGAGIALSAALTARSAALLVVGAGRSKSTRSAGAPSSLAEVRAAADPASFPRQVLAGAPKTVSFFSAAFHGRNDCIHLADGGVADALLVDLDDDKLAEMRTVYPPTWRFAAGDAYVVAESLRAAGETFDLVVVDGWTGEAERMLTENFPLWCALSRRWTILMVSRPWFDKQGVEPTPAAVEAWVRRTHALEVKVDELHFRAHWVGGVWWIVVRAIP